MKFADHIVEEQRRKRSMVVLGVDPQLDTLQQLPPGYNLTQFCCGVIEACANSIVAVKPQLAFFEARGVEGMRTLVEVVRAARRMGLLTIADAKRGDIGPTSEAYAEAFLGNGDFGCDAACVNPYLGMDAIMPFVVRIRAGRGVFVIVKTSNPSSGEFQDLLTPEGEVWEVVAKRVHGLGSDYLGANGLSSVGAVVGATYPDHARRARELMPNTMTLVPGYGAQGAKAADALAGVRSDGLGTVVNASRSIMYAFRKTPELSVESAAAKAAEDMRLDLNRALENRNHDSGNYSGAPLRTNS